jgi:serpin B
MKTWWIAGALLLCCPARTEPLNDPHSDQNQAAHPRDKGTFPMTESAIGQNSGAGRKLLPVETLAQDVSAFAIDLYHQLRGSEGNLFLSPYGISAALAMAHAGARGNTETQMARALRYTLRQESLHPAFAELGSGLAKLQEGGHIKLRTANSVWPQQGYPLLHDYLSLVQRHYGVSVAPLRYRDAPEAARETINRWVETRTDHKIKDLIQPGVLAALTRLVIVNAIYFGGEWASKFQASLTRSGPFLISPGRSVPISLMKQEGEFRYGEVESIQVLELPYLGRTLSMLILLPREKDGLKQLEHSLSVENLARWRNALREQEVEVYLPRFRTTCTFRLDQTLSAMGMADAFDANKADFSGMDGRPGWLCLGAVLHKTYVDVSEEGTEAAAATPVMAQPTAAEGQPPVFRADHPFLFAICEAQNGTVLFFGRLADPTMTGE